MFSINFEQDQNELVPYWCAKKVKVPNEYIASIYPNCRDWNGFILPPRFLKYLSFDYGELKLMTSSLGDLVEHCRLQHGNYCVGLDCAAFSKSVFWRDYLIHSYKRNPAYNVSVDVAYAYAPLQAALSGIEALCLNDYKSDPHDGETVKAVSYVILHNIATSEQPCLQHLKINSYAKWIASGVSKFFFESKGKLSNLPYLLESLALSVVECSSETCELLSHFKSLIVDFRPEFFKSKKKNHLNQEKVCNALVKFLKQPQTCSLSLAMLPLPETCKLVETFLTTPTTMEQNLLIICDDRNKDIRDAMPPPINQPIPESSAHFKCLKLSRSSSRFRAWFYSLSEVKLKSISLCESDALIPQFPDSNFPCSVFQVRYISLTYPTSNSTSYLDKFLLFNSALKELEIRFPKCCFYPAFTHCLSMMCQQEGRTLEELHLVEGSFVDVSMKEFFTVIRDLSLQCGTTLVLIVPCLRNHKYFSEEQMFSVLPDLSKEFQTKKIKKIICKRTKETIPENFEIFKQRNASSLNLISQHVEFS